MRKCENVIKYIGLATLETMEIFLVLVQFSLLVFWICFVRLDVRLCLFIVQFSFPLSFSLFMFHFASAYLSAPSPS